MFSRYTKKFSVLALVLALFATMASCSSNKSQEPLKSWSDTSLNKQKIISFVTAVTDKNGKDFVPVANRIATFDLDGTLVCEKPLWLELAVAEHRILTEMQDNKELVEKVAKLNDNLKQNPEPPDTGKLIDEVTGEAFLNMPQEDFVKYMEAFMNNEKAEFTDLQYKDTFYKPMLELVSYLLDHEFQVYIASGSERGVIWGACKEALPNLPRSHQIGADIALKPLNQANPQDSSYIFSHEDELIRQTGFTQKDLKLWKVYNIYHQIGSKPILAFGNTDGDFSMLNYAKSNDMYRSESFLLSHDDDAREYDYNVEQRVDWNNKAKENNWNVVSMAQEFAQVFMKDTSKK